MTMATGDNSYQVTGKVCPPSLPMSMMMGSSQWAASVPPGVLQSLLVESPTQEVRSCLPENLCALVSQAQVLLSTDEGSSTSSIVSLPYYFCNFCDHHTDSKALLLKHLAETHIFQCCICNFFSFTRSGLVQHQLKVHIDAKELNPVLSTKFVQLNPSQLHRRLQSDGLVLPISPERHRIRDNSVSQVSSASSHHQDNFLLLPDSHCASDLSEDSDSISTTQCNSFHSSGYLGARQTTPTGDRTEEADPVPHFLDMSFSRVCQKSQKHAGQDRSPSCSMPCEPVQSSVPNVAGTSNAPGAALFENTFLEEDSCDESREKKLWKHLRQTSTGPPTMKVLRKQIENAKKEAGTGGNICGSTGPAPARNTHNVDIESIDQTPQISATVKNNIGTESHRKETFSKELDNVLVESKKSCGEGDAEANVSSLEALCEERQGSGKYEGAVLGKVRNPKNYDILRGLLIGEAYPKANALNLVNAQVSEKTMKKNVFLPCSSAKTDFLVKESDIPPVVGVSKSSSTQSPTKRASDMSLKELLTQPSSVSCKQVLTQEASTQAPVFCGSECDRISQHPELVGACQQNYEHGGGRTTSTTTETVASQNIEHPMLSARSDGEDSDSDVCEIAEGKSGRDQHVNSTQVTTTESAFPPDNCVASKILQSMSKNCSGGHSLSQQNNSALIRTLMSQPRKPSDNALASNQAETPSLLQKSQLETTNRQKRSCRFKQKYVFSEEDCDDAVSCDELKVKTSRKRRRDDSDDAIDYASSSEDSDDSSGHSSSEARVKRRCRKAKPGLLMEGKNKHVSDTLSCLHCYYTDSNKYTIRKHLNTCHPYSVPFAIACLKSGKKSIVFFCQGFESKCSFFSSKGAEIISHIKLCYMELLDNFSSKPQSDFSSVLSSMGIASKLLDSSPSTFYCLRCEFTKHSLQPMLGHVRRKHRSLVAGVLHVRIGSEQPRHTQVHMLCLVCLTDVSVDQWRDHPCRMRRDNNESETGECAANIGSHSSLRINPSEPGTPCNNITEQNEVAEKVHAEARKALLGLRKTLESPKEDVNITSSNTQAVGSVQSSEADRPNQAVEHNCAESQSIKKSPAHERHSSEENVCVISSCFSVNPRADIKSLQRTPTSSQSITMSLLENTMNTTKSSKPNLNTGSGEKAVSQGSTSVLHDLLVSSSPNLSSTRALNLLQNLLTGPGTFRNISGEKKPSESSHRQPSLTHTASTHPQRQDLLSSPMLAPSRPQSSGAQNNARHDKQLSLDNPVEDDTKSIEPCSSSTTIKTEINEDMEYESIDPSGHGDGFSAKPDANVGSSQHGHAGQATSPTMLPLGENMLSDSEKIHSSESRLSPPLVIPTPPQLPAHLRPLSPSPQPSSSAENQNISGLSLFPTTKPEPLQASPFTNLLRGLLSMSQRKDNESQ